MEDDKAPGPDGFSTRYLKTCWDVVGKEILEVFEAFHKQDQWCRSLSVTFITLILKKKEASEAKGYRPISLVGCLYKLLAKTLAIKLKQVMGSIILKTQNSFLPGRQILDCSLLANESIDAMFKVGWPGVVCKVDIEKAYDHVNWGYLDMSSRENGVQGQVEELDQDLYFSFLFGVGKWLRKRILQRKKRFETR